MKISKKVAAGILLIAILTTSGRMVFAGDPATSPGYPNPQGTTKNLPPGATDKLLPGMTTNPPPNSSPTPPKGAPQ